MRSISVGFFTVAAAASALAVALAALAAPARATQPEPASAIDVQIEFHDGRLSVTAEDAPVGAVLRAVGGAAGLEIPSVPDTGATFTGTFSALPLAEGLERLLRPWSYTLLYDDAGKPHRVVLLPTTVGEAMPVEAAEPEDDSALVERRSPPQEELWITQRLANTDLGARVVAVRRLDRLPPERARAIGRRVLYTEPEPVVRAQLAEALGRVDGAGVEVVLQELLADRDLSVRIAAAEALGRFASDGTAHSLGRILLEGKEPALRQAALRSLASRQGKVANDYLALMATRDGDDMADLARRAQAGQPVFDAPRYTSAASPCLHAVGRLAGTCHKQ